MKNELLYGNKEESINTASLGVFTLFAGILCQFSSSKNLQSFGKTPSCQIQRKKYTAKIKNHCCPLFGRVNLNGVT